MPMNMCSLVVQESRSWTFEGVEEVEGVEGVKGVKEVEEVEEVKGVKGVKTNAFVDSTLNINIEH